MTPASRILALKAYRLAQKNITGKELAKRLGVYGDDEAAVHALRGRMIAEAEALQLTEREWLVMKTLARLEARRVALAFGTITTAHVDRAARKHSGWCRSVVDPRLRINNFHAGESIADYFGFVALSPLTGTLWLTRTGWAFVWEAKLIKPNWKVPS